MTADPRATLARLAAHLRLLTDDEAAQDVADWMDADAVGDLGDILDAPPGWRRSTASRNSEICDARQRHFPYLPRDTVAQRIADGLQRYYDTEWDHTLQFSDCPHEPDTIDALYWRILRRGGRVLKQSTIDHILQAGRE